MATSIKDKIGSSPTFNTKQKDMLNYVAERTPLIKYASSDHTVNVSTTLANDSELYFDVKKNKKYLVEVQLFTTADGTDGIKVAFNTATDPTAARVYWKYLVDNVATQSETQTDLTSPAPTGVAAAITKIEANGYIQAADDGRITLQSALVADNNAATTIHTGSYLKVYEIE